MSVDKLSSSEIVNAFSLLLAIVGIILAYIFYRRGLKVKEPCWDIRGRTIIKSPTSGISDVRVYFRDEQVPHISVDRIVLWNAGKETIDRQDIVSSDPLRIEPVDEGVLLDAEVVIQNNPHSGIKVSLAPDRRQAIVEFEYIDEDNGAVIQLISTSEKPLSVFGSIKGARKVKRTHVPTPPVFILATSVGPELANELLSPRTRRKLNRFTSFGVLFVGIGLPIKDLLLGSLQKEDLVVGGIFTVLGVLGLVISRSSRLPKSLGVYEDVMAEEG